MNTNWEIITAIYDEAIDLEESSRHEFVSKKCKEDLKIFAQVMKMLEASHSQDFMGEFPGKINADNIDLSIPKQLGHFEILKKIATGGMGRVYLGQSTTSDVQIKVALKTIRIELISQELKNKFQNEKNILSQLRHKNIASLIDAGISDNQIPYIATEWVNGINIKDYCIENKLSIKQRLHLFLQICEAMIFAHNKMIIHRDLKPDNILVNNHRQVKLLDFGIAKIIDENLDSLTQTQIFTPDYAAPEQLSGQMCTAATDIYSLGIILFEILTNTKRFNLSGLAIAAKIKAIAIPKQADLSDVQPDKPLPYSITQLKGPLYNIINKAMHVEPNRRYNSVASLVSDIENYLENRPIKAMKDSLFYKTSMLIKRNKLSSVFLFMILTSIIGGFYFSNKQKEVALKEAKKSEKVLEFFKVILEQTSPAEGGSTQISVKEMFTKGIKKYKLSEISDDYTRAELSAQIGHIYIQMDEKKLGVENLENAVKYYQNRLFNLKNAKSYIKYSNLVASAYLDERNYTDAKKYLNNVFHNIKGFDFEDENICESYIMLASAVFIEDKKQAMDYLNKAEAIGIHNNYFMVVGTANFYKHSLFYADISIEESLKYLDLAESNFEIHFKGEANPNSVSVMASKAAVLGHSGNYLAAEEGFEKVSKMNIDFYGRDKYITLINRSNNIYMAGKFDRSLSFVTKAEELFVQSKHDKNITYYGLIMSKASSLIEFGEYSQAEALLTIALNYFQKTLPAGHRIIKIVQNKLADLYLKSNDFKKIKAYKTVLENYIREGRNDKLNDKLLVSIYTNLGNIYHLLGEFEKSQNYLSKSLAKMNKNLSVYINSWQYSAVQTGLAFANLKLRKIVNRDAFYKYKQQLIDRAGLNKWYDEFFTLE